MIRSIKQLFVRDRQLDSANDPADFNPKSISNPNFLTEPVKIGNLLEAIETTRPLCTVTFDGIEEEFSTSILDINRNHKSLMLDELIPEYGNNLLHAKKAFKLSTFYNGIHLAFKLDKIQFSTADGIDFYTAHFPKRIYYPQRRKSPRISLHSARITFAGIASRTKTSLGGIIFDISRNGVGITLTDNRARIQRGDNIKSCAIILDDHRLDFELHVRFMKKSGTLDNPQIFVGGYFQNLSSKSQNKLSYFISAMEREQIRKQKNK
jgi:c-di-GMP-binding flagellar brake protein YcgR